MIFKSLFKKVLIYSKSIISSKNIFNRKNKKHSNFNIYIYIPVIDIFYKNIIIENMFCFPEFTIFGYFF